MPKAKKVSTNPKAEKNVFFDINKFPPEKGLLLFPISMSRMTGRQNGTNFISDIRHFSPTKISKPLVGVNIIYGDFLYLYSNKSAPELKNTFMEQVINHKNRVQKLVEKNHLDFQIQHAFNFMVWNQLYVGSKDFGVKFDKIKKIYKDDKLFQKYLQQDCEDFGRPMEDNQVNFFLEESLMFYLLSHNEIKLPNEYIENNQKWILACYPGKPIRSIVYISKINPFKLDWLENPYQNANYDLESKKLIRFDDIDLETYSPK